MKKGRISQHGYLQTVGSYLDINDSTLQDWQRKRYKSSRRYAIVKMIYSDLNNAQKAVMEKWAKDPELKELVEKTKKHPRYKGY